MARKSRSEIPNIIYHVLNRGNNRQIIFIEDKDYKYFIEKLIEAKEKYPCKFYSYVLMPNHIHLLIEPLSEGIMAKCIKMITQRYAQYMNKKYNRTGTLWEGRFKSCMVSNDNYLIMCCKYIEVNPVRAGIVKKPEEYKWSSYNTKIGNENNYFLDLDVWHESLGKDDKERQEKYKSLFNEIIADYELKSIRENINKNSIYANEEFKQQIKEKMGLNIGIRRKRGRPKNEPVPNYL